MSAQSAIRTISFVGLGLIGTSLLRAFRLSQPAGEHRLVMKGYDPSFTEKERLEVLDLGLDRFETDKKSLYDADLIVLSAPVQVNIELLDEIREYAASPVLVTDVSSTKTLIAEKARKLGIPFIGMHPMAGREQRGFRAAHEELLRGKTVILCDNGAFLDGPVGQELMSLLESAGCHTMLMDPVSHDRIVANISHLPQLLSTLLINYCEKNIAASGPGFATLARLSGSSWSIWQDIVLTNSDNITAELEGFAGELLALASDVKNENVEGIASRFSNANRLYETLKELHKP